MTIFSNPDRELVAKKTIEAINTVLSDTSDKNILLLLSGGSAISLYDELSLKDLAENLTICFLDERYSTDDSINNFAQIQKTEFYKRAINQGATVIDTVPDERESINELAERFEIELKEWRNRNKDGIVVGIIGIGPDGHTSGIMPFPEDHQKFEELFCGERWVVEYDAGNKNEYPMRVTTTITFLKNEIDYGIVYAVGENKKEALENIMKSGPLSDTPGRVIHEMKNIQLFTDVSLQTKNNL